MVGYLRGVSAEIEKAAYALRYVRQGVETT
jgi:hypothetical protein